MAARGAGIPGSVRVGIDDAHARGGAWLRPRPQPPDSKWLLEVFQRAFENIGGADAGVADKVVREHLLKNVYGFEYLIAPYAIAHLELDTSTNPVLRATI